MSVQPSVCNHRVYEVVIVFEAAVITAFLAGIVLVLMGMSPIGAVAAGGATLAGFFGLSMAAVTYVRRHEN